MAYSDRRGRRECGTESAAPFAIVSAQNVSSRPLAAGDSRPPVVLVVGAGQGSWHRGCSVSGG